MSLWKTLFPGPIGDRMAFAELEGAIRVASAAFANSRHALATAIVERDRESARVDRLAARAADLEDRAVLAVRKGRADLAEAAAQAIAAIEAEHEAAQAATSRYAQNVVRLREGVERQRRRLADLDRGRRLARVDAAAARTDAGPGARRDPFGRDAVERAEALLDGLQRDNARDLALIEMASTDGEALRDRMAEAGIGAPLRPLAIDVLKRIEAKAAAAAAALPATPQTSD